ncbi:TonB-dependent receptor [Sphingobium sufflavum]|uniref:TonB-dependent receptor n=1 Tax=Sphingobium sufflavum TaxID=1129547 RepID=UPI001F20CEDA|nr:TonB-dependent receptor [Sphingobium sufflavum]MCE7795152.1 TonB-dependent receptor [Sphingobium sufflavum]
MTTLWQGPLATVLLLWPASVLAQGADAAASTAPASPSAASPGAASAEIVVTAQKRPQRAADVGIPMAVLDRGGLSLVTGQDETALARQLPGVRVQSFSPSITIFNIRGVSQNDYSDAQEGPIAFYEDEVYVSVAGAIAGRAFDLERVEVLRGPQGTLFGRNATGGLIHYVTARPTDRPVAQASLTFGSYGQVASEGALGGPLTDRLRARLSWSLNRHDGFIDNSAGPDVGNSRFYAGRLQLAADVGDGDLLSIKVQGLRNDRETSAGYYSHRAAAPDALGLGRYLGASQDAFGTCAGCDALGYREPDDDPFTVAFNDPILFDRTLGEIMGRYDATLGAVRLTVLLDYQHLAKDYAEDSDMSPVTLLTAANQQRLDQWFGEVRLSGEGRGVRWLAGVNGLHIASDNHYVIDAANSAGLLADYGGRQTIRSAAVFGQAEVDLTPRLTLIAGARFTHDTKTYHFSHSLNGIRDLLIDPVTVPALAHRDFTDWSGKFQLDYRPVPGVLLYAGVDRGTKSGGFSAPAILPQDPAAIGFEPERLTSWSAGAKASFWQGRATLALAAFHYDYDRYQAFENADGFVLSVRNKDARIDGVEVEGEVRPLDGLSVGGSAAWLWSKVRNVILPSGAILDRQMPNAPRFSGTAHARYDWRVPGGTASLATGWRHESGQYLTPFNAAVDHVPAHLVGDVRLAWQGSASPLGFALFVNNVTDRRYRLFDIDFSQNFGFVQSSFARPRWIGFSISYGR